jgi:2-iminoacetate synthase
MFTNHFEDLWRQVSARPIKPLDDPDFGAAGPFDQTLLQQARDAKQARFHNTVEAVSPLYVSSICKERCTYCNYRAGSEDPSLKRVRLSDDDLTREVEFLVAQRGLRAVELVYASDPQLGVDDYIRHIRLTRAILEQHGATTVGLSAEPVSTDDYRRLRDAGLNFSVVWQETYDPHRYAELHPGNQIKSDFHYRLSSFERMLEAGLEGVGYGVLSGLADWRRDWSMLALHQQYLRDTYGRGPNILGIPRLKPAPGASFRQRAFVPTDDEFLAVVAWHNLQFPNIRTFISTREEFDLCLQLAAGGGCLFTFNCSTVPGGYTLPNRGAQFFTGNYDTPIFAPQVEAAGYQIHWNWRH